MAGSRVFYVAMAGLLLLTAVAGFGSSYIAPVVGGASIGPAVLHLHAGVAFAWSLLFLSQTLLVAGGSVVTCWGIFGPAET